VELGFCKGEWGVVTRGRVFHVLLVVLAVVFGSARTQGQETVRVASYNIKFLSTAVQSEGNRLQNLRQVIELLDADVIGLQEIADRAALNLVFPPADWSVVIDDDSTDVQDVAIVVRKPLTVIGLSNGLDADDENFLFSGSAHESFFPNRRDLLFVEIGAPGESWPFFVMVNHAKSRLGGRTVTDSRRESASKAIVNVLKQDFDDKHVILLGDFNDNPDDRSLNILETGDPNALGGPEEIPGPFMLNLMEALCAQGHVSHGRTSSDIDPVTGRINTIDSQSRDRNNDARGTNDNTGDILFDQILIPAWMGSRYVQGSAHVFDLAIAMQGNNTTRASDHLPVYAEFAFGDDTPSDPVTATGVRLVSLLPNPAGDDKGRESVAIRNFTAAAVSLSGWKLKDAAGNTFALAGSIPAGGTLSIVMTNNSMPLNNNGDTVTLVDDSGAERHSVSYVGSQATSGNVVEFPGT